MSRKDPSPAQSKQRKLYIALGYVTGFYGWIICLESILKGVESFSRVDTTNLRAITNELRKELHVLEETIRFSMKEIKK